jgi:hypothetical protein
MTRNGDQPKGLFRALAIAPSLGQSIQANHGGRRACRRMWLITRPFGTQITGQTENALYAILDRQLAGTGLTEPERVGRAYAGRA